MTEVTPGRVASIRSDARGRSLNAPQQAPGRRPWLLAGAGAVAVVAILAWLWPGIARDGGDVDVLVVGDGAVATGSDAIQRSLRERGLRTEVATVSTPCAAAPVLEDTKASVVVLSFLRSGGGCANGDDTLQAWDEARRAAPDARVVLLVQPGPAPAGQDADVRAAIDALEPRRDVIVANAATLLGETAGSPARMPCEWWDDCEPDGFTTVRQPDGSLGPAGDQRLARVLVGAMP
jgi:hypothetical protein